MSSPLLKPVYLVLQGTQHKYWQCTSYPPPDCQSHERKCLWEAAAHKWILVCWLENNHKCTRNNPLEKNSLLEPITAFFQQTPLETKLTSSVLKLIDYMFFHWCAVKQIKTNALMSAYISGWRSWIHLASLEGVSSRGAGRTGPPQ